MCSPDAYVCRSALAVAKASRGWRMWADIAALLIKCARKLYSDTDLFGLDLKNAVYAFDATTIGLCLSLFDWTPFSKAKAAVKVHTLLGLRGAIPAFIHITSGKMHEVNVLVFLPKEVRQPHVHGFTVHEDSKPPFRKAHLRLVMVSKTPADKADSVDFAVTLGSGVTKASIEPASMNLAV